MPQGTRERPFVLPGSLASQALDRVDYLDVFSAPVPKRATLDEVAARVLGGRPPWLMRLRDALVRPFGLKTTPPGPRKPQRFVEGGRVGLFRVFARSEEELVLGEDDKHLDFRVCLRVLGDGEATLATLVRFHNGWGRAYFACVRPFHGLIVKGMLRRAGAHPVSESN
jgi:hypothetical protein